MPYDEQIEALHTSDQSALRTVDSLADDQWAGPSALPGWTRAHVVAHLALNGEGFGRALEGVLGEKPEPVYDSDEIRDADIAELADQKPSEIRERYFAATQRLRDLFSDLHDQHWEATVSRLPDGPIWPVPQLVTTRQLEVEIHHADLDVAYSARDWPADFTVRLLDLVTSNHAAAATSPDFTVLATDLGRTWPVGAETPVVSGTAADLGWWLVGRGEGRGLTCGDGQLPEVGPWTRPVRR